MTKMKTTDASQQPEPRVFCADCRHWKSQPSGEGWTAETIENGVCGKISEGSRSEGAKAETFNHWGDDSGLMTDPDFSCIHGERA